MPAHLLDIAIDSALPTLRTPAELAAFESTPYADRICPQSTYEALRLGFSTSLALGDRMS